MRPTIIEALEIVFWSMLTLLLPSIFLAVRLWRILEKRHPEVWDDLGKPSLSNLNATAGKRVTAFIRHRDYQSIDDGELRLFGTLLWALNWVYTLGFAVFFLLIFAAVLAP